MRRLVFSIAAVTCLLHASCASDDSEVIDTQSSAGQSTDTQAAAPKPLPPRIVRSGPPDFSTIEPELVSYADWYSRMTALQEQEAVAKNDGPIEDFGRKLVGRSFRFTGRVADVERVNGSVVVHLDYQPIGASGRVAESGESLQRAFYSEEEWRKRRAWRVSIKLPLDAALHHQAEQWGKGQWLAFDARVEATDGYQLKRSGAKALFASNRQIVRAIATHGPVQGIVIGPGSVVMILVDRSGSMMDEFSLVTSGVNSILRSLSDDSRFALCMFGDTDEWLDALPAPSTRENVMRAIQMVDGSHPGGRSNGVEFLRIAYAAKPTHLICITDGSLGNNVVGLTKEIKRRIGEHPETKTAFVDVSDGDWLYSDRDSRMTKQGVRQWLSVDACVVVLDRGQRASSRKFQPWHCTDPFALQLVAWMN